MRSRVKANGSFRVCELTVLQAEASVIHSVTFILKRRESFERPSPTGREGGSELIDNQPDNKNDHYYYVYKQHLIGAVCKHYTLEFWWSTE